MQNELPTETLNIDRTALQLHRLPFAARLRYAPIEVIMEKRDGGGFDLLLPFLETDDALRKNFLRELDVVFYAGAALPQNLWERIKDLAIKEKDGRLAMLSGWGSTETAPMATCVHMPIERAGVIGGPTPGCELMLVPSGGKLEVRVKGPNVTPG